MPGDQGHRKSRVHKLSETKVNINNTQLTTASTGYLVTKQNGKEAKYFVARSGKATYRFLWRTAFYWYCENYIAIIAKFTLVCQLV